MTFIKLLLNSLDLCLHYSKLQAGENKAFVFYLYPAESEYCKSWNFRESFIFVNSDTRHICDKKIATRAWFIYISKQQSDVPNSWGFNFHETLFCENKTITKISEFTVISKPINQSFRPLDKSMYLKIIFSYFSTKHMLWVLKRTVSMRRFFCAPKTHVQCNNLERKNHNLCISFVWI